MSKDLPTRIQRGFWQNTFGTGGEAHPWWRHIIHITGSWMEIGTVQLGIADPDDESKTITRVVGWDQIQEAVFETMSTSVDACTGWPIAIGPDMDWDSCVSDCVLQTAVLGKVVYG